MEILSIRNKLTIAKNKHLGSNTGKPNINLQRTS